MTPATATAPVTVYVMRDASGAARSPDEPTTVPTDVLYHASGHAVGSPPARRRTAGTGGGR